MAGLLDGMRISKSGILAHSHLQEVVGHNIANASREGYSRQKVLLDSGGSVYNGKHFFGQGVDMQKVVRERDLLLDGQVRESSAQATYHATATQWLQKIERSFNEPSDTGINAGLTQFFEAFHELSSDPENLAVRAHTLSETKRLASVIQETEKGISGIYRQIDREIETVISEVNALMQAMAKLNQDIFNVEAGTDQQANDLRDRRDLVLDQLAELLDISYFEDSNGMVDVAVNHQPAVMGTRFETLSAKNNPFDGHNIEILWHCGDTFNPALGKMGALLQMKEQILPAYLSELNQFTGDLIAGVNSVYANGTSQMPKTTITSNLGYAALGAFDVKDPLNLTAQPSAIKVSFYNSQQEVVRTASIVVHPQDSLQDIALTLNTIQGLDASLLAHDPDHPGRLMINFDSSAPGNVLGEVGFALSNHEGSYDSSGFLDFMGFSATLKSTNTSATDPVLSSVDLSTLQTELKVSSIAAVRSKAMGMQGTFYLNTYETATETAPLTNGQQMGQFAIQIDTGDSIDDVMAKVNALTPAYGIAMSYNAITQKMELTSTQKTDSSGNVSATGTYAVRLAFTNGYRYPEEANDQAPAGYTGLADNTGLLAKLQLNTLLSGTNAHNIGLDSTIRHPQDLNAGNWLSSGSNETALRMAALEQDKIALGGQFTLAEAFGNLIASIGTDVRHEMQLAENDQLLLQGYVGEKDRISGVNLDEELSNMLLYQRSYDANAKMLAVFNDMIEELLQKLR